MAEILTIKIDCTKIQKERLYQGKNGAKYLDAVLIPTPNDKYGNSHFIAQSVSKEEREAGKRGPIIGNAKILATREKPESKTEDAPLKDESDDV